MSNVLIGIIGVILFIGLALAGALILGDDFKAANSDTKAASVVQQMSQTAHAVTMYTVKTGAAKDAEVVRSTSNLIPRFLKTVPVNPVTNAANISIANSAGATTSGRAASVLVVLGTGDEARNVCESIQRQTGYIAPTAAFDNANRNLNIIANHSSQSGCLRSSSAYYGFLKL